MKRSGTKLNRAEFFTKKKKSPRTNHYKNQSRFVACPLCSKSIPIHTIEVHASKCDGEQDTQTKLPTNREASIHCSIEKNDEGPLQKSSSFIHRSQSERISVEPAKLQWSNLLKSRAHSEDGYEVKNGCEIPGLYIHHEFITEKEEKELIAMLDGRAEEDTFLPWRQSKFNGKHIGKRWGVHCSLKDRKVYPEENPLPSSLMKIIERIKSLDIMDGCAPNEANAISYRKNKGDYLRSHVDDRQLSKEPIANLSLGGDCLMKFQLEKEKTSNYPKMKKVLLRRRTLQILTKSARYDYSHGIENNDLLTERRISITMRESPLTK